MSPLESNHCSVLLNRQQIKTFRSNNNKSINKKLAKFNGEIIQKIEEKKLAELPGLHWKTTDPTLYANAHGFKGYVYGSKYRRLVNGIVNRLVPDSEVPENSEESELVDDDEYN